MSLHLANLSPRIRKDELEREFRRFGRCTVQLKDGYGFAVYDFRENAEKALRTLKGRKICGQSVYLSWSNKQPKPMQRLARSDRPHDMRYGRNSGRSGNFRGRNLSRSHGDYSMNDKHLLDKGRERHQSAGDCWENFNINDSSLAHYDPVEGVLKEGGRFEDVHNEIDNGSWGEQVDHLRNDSDLDEQREFDRYDPEFVDKRAEENENRGMECLACSQSAVTSPDKNRRLHADNKRGQETCFKCGIAGHRMHDCPSKEALREKSTYHSDHRHDAKAKTEVGSEDSISEGRLRSSSRNSRLTKRPDTDRKPFYSGKVEINGRRSPVGNEFRRDKGKDYNRKRRRERDDQIEETCDDKKLRQLALSHLHSDCISPELDTLSKPKKPFGSRSASPIPRSHSNSSRSNLRAHRCSSKSLKSKSRSRSRSPSSLSISLGQSLPSSPNKAHKNLNGFYEGTLNSPSKELLTEVGQHFEPEVREENLSIANRAERSLSRSAENATSYQLMEVPIDSKQHEHDSQTPTSTKDTEMSLNGFVKDDQIPHYQEVVANEKQSLPVQNFTPPLADAHLLSEDLSPSGKVLGDRKLDSLHNDDGSDSTIPQEAPSSSLLENDDKEAAGVKMAAHKPRRTEENTNALETAFSLEPASSKPHAGSHLSISAEELSRALKHYGLKHPEDTDQHLDVGDYFGSSRLWPWEMIYYRRLKKGPISMENYARRVVQNKAFNITDKYIRSSSGWGELIEDND